jgi:tetratricopeptide (TPR) repeat protein
VRRLLLLLLLAGCAGRSTGPYTPATEADRDPQRAQELTLQAADLVGVDDPKAEALLREALTCDLFHGPAHNNLGVVFLRQGRLYEAASEFEWAKKLLPGHPDPRVNLAMTLERAGRIDDALNAYEEALAAYPDHLQATQGLVRLQVRSGRRDGKTRSRLEDVALRGETEQWREWARRQAVRE